MSLALPKSKSHPCFYSGARGTYGRIHLPVARACNIQCSYCRRDCDCPHENRPGVSCGVIAPEEACERLRIALARSPHISVAAVAGPGDAFCEPELTLRTFELIRRDNPEIALCVSSNGLNLKEHIPALRRLDVQFVTITVNAIDPAIGARLCSRIVIDGSAITGIEAARILISRQLESIALLKAAGITVKINSVVVPGINDEHLLFVARKVGRLGVDLMNFIPLIPLTGTDLAGTVAPDKEEIGRLRRKAAPYVSQMHHCERCRSDASGLLAEAATMNWPATTR